jgi:hypothetical protein
MKKIQDVLKSETYKLFLELKKNGFNASLCRSFTYNYDKDNRYLSIYIKDFANRESELFDLCRHGACDVLLARFAECETMIYEIRRDADNKELVDENVWMEYWSEHEKD